MRKAANIDQKDIFKAIHRSQHCQRNWNLEAEVPESDIELILESITQCPSKQNKHFYNVHLLQDRSTIEQLHDLTRGFGLEDQSITTNSQTLAHLCIVFEAANTEQFVKQAYYNRLLIAGEDVNNINWDNHIPDMDLVSSCHSEVMRDQHMAVGVAAGYANLTGSLLGYGTGCCACFEPQGVKELLKLDGDCLLIMGIGVAGDKPRRVHHLDDSIVFPTKRKQPIAVKVY